METVSYLVDLVLHLDRHLEPILVEYGRWVYLLMFLVIFCETGLVATPFLPGDSLLFALGAFSASGSLSLPVLLLTLSLAAILGDTVNYWVGHTIGPKLLTAERFQVIKPHHLAYTEQFFEKYGAKTIVLARFVPIVRTLAPFVAGLGSMNYARFITYNIVGGIAWVSLCTIAGNWFGNLPFVKENFSLVVLAIIVLSVLPMVWEVLKARQLSRKSMVSRTPIDAAVADDV